MNNDTTDLILTLYSEEELSEYAARMLLDDETINRYDNSLEKTGRITGHETRSDEMGTWPDDIPMPYGPLSEEEYYAEGKSC